jgi:hypothetical protein
MKRFLIVIYLGFGIWSLGFAPSALAVTHKWEVGQGTGLTTTEFVVKDARTGIDAIRLVIDASGNLGIGTTGPVAKLEVNQASAASSLKIADNGTTVQEIYDGGIIDLPYQSTAKAYMGGTSQTVSNSTWTKLPINTKSWDTQNEFDTTNNRFTATKAGYYLVLLKAYWDSIADQKICYHAVYKNGASEATQAYQGSGPALLQPVSVFLIKLAAGDYIEFYVFQNSGGDTHINGGSSYSDYTYMEIIKLM